jgi:cell shape-determining protein MreC
VGFEQSPEYERVAKAKLAKETRQAKINGMWFSCYLRRIASARDIDVQSSAFREIFDWVSGAPAKALNSYAPEFKEVVQTQIDDLCQPFILSAEEQAQKTAEKQQKNDKAAENRRQKEERQRLRKASLDLKNSEKSP